MFRVISLTKLVAKNGERFWPNTDQNRFWAPQNVTQQSESLNFYSQKVPDFCTPSHALIHPSQNRAHTALRQAEEYPFNCLHAKLMDEQGVDDRCLSNWRMEGTDGEESERNQAPNDSAGRGQRFRRSLQHPGEKRGEDKDSCWPFINTKFCTKSVV